MVVRWTLPRFRYDQLMNLAWKLLIPLSGLLLIGTAVLVYLDRTQWWWMMAMNVVIGVVAYLAQPWLPRMRSSNARVRLPGSRFFPPQEATAA